MATAHLTIDLDAIARNWRVLNEISAPSVTTAAVVKADSYGLGAAKVARCLARAGAKHFFVAAAEEGAEIRKALGSDAWIGVFSGHMGGDTNLIRDNNLVPMLNSPEQVVRHLNTMGDHAFGIQLDSGMNRLGLEPADWANLRQRVLSAGPELVMSHLACADEPDHENNANQLRAFREMTHDVEVPLSFSATGGILLGPEYHMSMTRPGIGLYGGLPFRGAAPVVRLMVPVVQTRIVEPGESVGYGCSWVATERRKIATIAAGYADGFLRSMSNKAQLFCDGMPCPLIGRVSMDLITVDVTELGDVPEYLEMLGSHQSVDMLADAAGTIGYEILTSLGHRYVRHYAGAGL
ncbi:MAG: alanine racemase [Mangrovicoccus sp.]